MSAAHFDITGDNSNIVNIVNDTIERMEELARTAKDLSYGEDFDFSTPEKGLKSLQGAIEKNEAVMRDYQKQLDELAGKQQEAALAGDTEKVKQYGEQMATLAQRCQEAATETESLKNALGDVGKEMDKNSGIMVKMLGGQEKYNAIISELPTPLRNAVTGLNGMTKAAKAFIATPLGAVLAALILAYKALTTWLNKSSEGQRALAKITGYFSGVVAGLLDVVKKVGKALYDAFTNPKEAIINLGNSIKDYVIGRFRAVVGASQKLVEAFGHLNRMEFNEAGQSFKDAWSTLVDGSIADKVGDTVKKIHEVGKAESDLNVKRDQLRRERMDWMKEEGELDKQIAEQRNKLYVGTTAERQAASAKMMDLINKKYDKQVEFAQREYEIKRDSNALTDSSLEDLEEEAGLQKQVLELEAQRESSKRMALRVEGMASRSAQATAEKESELNEKRKEILTSLSDYAAEAERQKTTVTISAMKEGFAKEKAELEHEHEEKKAQLEIQARERLEKVENLQKAEYKARHGGSTSGFVVNTEDDLYQKALAVNQAEADNEELEHQAKMARLEKEVLDERNANRWEYLEKFGEYKDKVLAITEKYDKAIEDAEDEFRKKLLEKEKENALNELQKQYSASYALIFADAGRLADNYLEKAIEETQKAIREAEKSGDTQRLTELYERLRKQIDEQNSRKGLFSGIVQGFGDVQKARKAMQDAMDKDDAEAFAEALKDESSALSLIESSAKKATGWVSSFADMLRSFDTDGLNEVADLFDGLGSNVSQIVGAFSNVGQEVSSSMKMSAISAGIEATQKLVTMIGTSIAKNKKAQEEWNKTIEQSEHKLAMLRLQELDYRKENIFGVENPYKKAIDGAIQYGKAIETLRGSISKLYSGQVQTGTKKALDWGNIGKGFATGAGAGAMIGGVAGGGVFSWATAAIGAVIGGIAGAVAGAFSTKVEPILENISSRYGQLFNENYELNPQLLADYDKLDETTKQIVDNWEEIVAKAKEAEEQMRQNFSDLAGDIGNQLSDSLVEAFRNGELDSAIDDFHQKMTNTIEDILEQLVFSATFGAMFKELEDKMMKSFGEGGDQDIVDDLIWMEQEYQDKLDQYNSAMQNVKNSLNNLGYDVFAADDTDKRVAQTKSALGASQDSVDESNARLTTIQSHTYEINENVKKLALLASLGAGDMLPITGAASGLQVNYGGEIAAIREALALQLQQSAVFAEGLSLMQSRVDGLLASSREIEGNTARGIELSGKIKSGLDTAIDRGVKML